MALLSPSSSVMVFPALILIAISGIDLLVGNVQIANLSESARCMVIILLDGFYSSSPVVWLLIKLGYEHGVSRRNSFIFLSCCTVFLWIRTYSLMPLRRLTSPCPKENHKYTPYDLLVRGKDTQNYEKIEYGGTCCKCQGFSTEFRTHLRNPLFWSNAFWYCCTMLRLIFYFGNAGRLAGGYHFPIRGQLLD